MRIIKPYGKSRVGVASVSERRRVLRRRVAGTDHDTDIAAFAASHPELLIAQWISAVDKIAKKPLGQQKPTREQKAFRERLGEAAWKVLVTKDPFVGLEADEMRRLRQVWDMKIAPYGTGEAKPDQKRKPPDPKGRWYGRFTSAEKPEDVDCADVARQIEEHLHAAEYRIHADAGKARRGRIEARADSIQKAVLKRTRTKIDWTEADQAKYAQAGDVAAVIRKAAQNLESSPGGGRSKPVFPSVAGKALFDHYPKVFKKADGTRMTIEEAKRDEKVLFDLHMAVKDCYARLLQPHRKSGTKKWLVSGTLPKNMEDLFCLVRNMKVNRDVNALIRLGKVIHYEWNAQTKNWPADIDASAFWGSNGQIQIKQSEAFIRVWRGTIAFAQRTLTDWADPSAHLKADIFGAVNIQKALNNISVQEFDAKCRVLFGWHADKILSTSAGDLRAPILELALRGWATLRHSAFHFKSLDTFRKELNGLPGALNSPSADPLPIIRKVWQSDRVARTGRLVDVLRGVEAERYLDEDQIRHLVDVLTTESASILPLPRFRNMLIRHENAWAETKNGDEPSARLPEPANRLDLEDPVRRCQYIILKLIYEKSFPAWFQAIDEKMLAGFINRAEERSTQAAKDLTPHERAAFKDAVRSRAADLSPRIADGKIFNFFFELAGATAAEMRIQKGYDSDGEQARKQAAYIEHLKCDVIALAFHQYIDDKDFSYLLAFTPTQERFVEPSCEIDTLAPLPEADTAEDWQKVLYFLLHMVPVDEVGRLLQQLRKHALLEAKMEGTPSGGAPPLLSVMTLYLDMHDAKFDGGTGIDIKPEFVGLFENQADFDRIFPPGMDTGQDTRVPKRGLREMLRFGGLRVLTPIFKAHKVAHATVDEYLHMEASDGDRSRIASHQQTREKLHEKWSKGREGALSADELKAYVGALQGVIGHRVQAAQATFTDHVRLHRLLMAVLSRLLDYSGLWERDVYFVCLALLHEAGKQPHDWFDGDGLTAFKDGQITKAIRLSRDDPAAAGLKADLFKIFERGGTRWKALVRQRNDLAHFNMLKPGAEANLDLTALVNGARALMAYDRKLKNAVSLSIMDLLAREGFELGWTMGGEHILEAARLGPRQIKHLREKKLAMKRKFGGRSFPICEDLHGETYSAWVAALFKGTVQTGRKNITHAPLDQIDWVESAKDRRHRKRDASRKGAARNSTNPSRSRARNKGRP